MDIKTLQFFLAVSEARNLQKVALQENVVPSAISRRLKILEEELGGQPLFKRRRHGLEPTAAGRTLAEHARKILTSLRELEFDMNNYAQGASGVIRIYASASSTASHLQGDIQDFLLLPENSKVNVQLTLGDHSNSIRALREGSISMAVVWNVQSFPDLKLINYRPNNLAVVVKDGHPLAKHSTIAYSETIEFDQVGLHSTRIAQSVLSRMTVIPQHSLQLRLELDSFNDCFKAVSAGIGICIMPMEATFELASHYGLVVIPLNDVWAKRHYSIALPSGPELQPIAVSLAKFLESRAYSSSESNIPLV